MGRMSAENIIADLGFYLALAVPFGISMGGADLQNFLNTIFAPWPNYNQIVGGAVTGAGKSCGALDFGCQASVGVAQATAYLGAVLSFPGMLLSSFLGRINAFGNLGNFLIFGPSGSLNAIPGGPLIITVFVIIVVFELFRMLRGSSVGA